MFARFAAVAGVVGAATAPITLPAHVDLSLLSADAPLSGSDTAIVVGGTFEPTPTDSFAQAAENLFLNPLGFDGGATDSSVCDMNGVDPCGATLQVLTTPETVEWDQSISTDASDITNAVENEYDTGAFSAADPLTVFVYSQSATAAGISMTQLAQAGIPSDAVHFVMIGDPSDTGGIFTNVVQDALPVLGLFETYNLVHQFDVEDVVAGNPGVPTPNDLYPTTVYTLNGDGFADFQQDYDSGWLPAVLSGILNEHLEYLGLTPAQVADSTTWTNGDITDIDISDADVNNATALAHAGYAGIFTSGFLQSVLGSFLNSHDFF